MAEICSFFQLDRFHTILILIVNAINIQSLYMALKHNLKNTNINNLNENGEKNIKSINGQDLGIFCFRSDQNLIGKNFSIVFLQHVG